MSREPAPVTEEEKWADLERTFSGSDNGMAQVFIAHRGKELANLVLGTPGPVALTIEDRLPIFSASKPFVATAIACLWERGHVELEAAVVRYLPELSATLGKSGVTLWHLLTHTAGLTGPYPSASDMGDWDAWKAIARSWQVQPAWTPGYRAEYDPQRGWVLLAMVLESFADRPYDEVVREMVLEPLGLERTSFLDQDRHLAWKWDNEQDDFVVQNEMLVGKALPGSGAISCASDLGRFYSSLLPGATPSVLTNQARSAMTAHHRVRVEEEFTRSFAGHGLGWELDFWSRHDPRISYRTFGYSGSESVRMFADPEHDLVVGYVASVFAPTSEVHYARQRCLASLAYDLAAIDVPETGRIRKIALSPQTEMIQRSLRTIVSEVIASFLNIESSEISDDQSLFDDLMLDSLALPEILATVSDAVGLEVTNEDGALFNADTTVRDFVLGLRFGGRASEFGDR